MTETPNLTPQKKEENQQYILDNLDKYVLDSRGSFVHVDSESLFNPEFKYYLIHKESVSNHEEIIDKISSMILQNKEDWKIVLDGGYYLENQRDGRKINEGGFGFEKGYETVGELGYREGAWKNYEEEIKLKREWKKLRQNSNSFHPSLSEQDQTEGKKLKKQLEEERKRAEEQDKNNPQTPNPELEKQNNNSDKQDKDNPLPQPEKENNNLPSPTDIQTNYDSDKDKSTIENNSNLTNPEQKEQAQELLKIIITAELSAKEKKFNPEILSRLVKEKEQNTSLYQLLNKEGRVDKIIKVLESIKKSQKDSNKLEEGNKKDNNQIPTGIIVGGICLVMVVGLGVIILARRRMSKKQKSS